MGRYWARRKAGSVGGAAVDPVEDGSQGIVLGMPATWVTFTLTAPARVTVKVWNTLAPGEPVINSTTDYPAGANSPSWDPGALVEGTMYQGSVQADGWPEHITAEVPWGE